MARMVTFKLIVAAAAAAIAAVALSVSAGAEQPPAAVATPASPAAGKAATSAPALQREGTSRTVAAGADNLSQAPQPSLCRAPADLAGLGMVLRRVARRLSAGGPLKIVALGSSSTAGAMASSPAASYPSRLAVYLQQRFPGVQITVVNRGVNGEEAPDMLKRLDKDVVAEAPDLVLWQVGTNAVLRDRSLDDAARLVHQGLLRIKASGADVVLIDPQYSPKVIAKREAAPMVDLIALAAKQDNVGLFRRFAVMRHWREDDRMGFDSFVAPDGLHMNDWSYGCWAKLLGGAIADASVAVTAVAGTSTGAKVQTQH